MAQNAPASVTPESCALVCQMRHFRRSAVDLLDSPVAVFGEAARVPRVHGVVFWPGPAAEAGGAVVEHRLLELGARVHHERAVMGDGLTDRFALEHEDFGVGRAVLATRPKHEVDTRIHANGR